ncbi:MAG: aminotransferase class I/II-fold pyridoxal phosphate-dependent enzyme [Anaerolineales bacterium]|nr:aminotransferase class I/II-fold pyridoxal phosphate-dependent enzyme [Anaerolineales bacterium]
MNFFLNSTFAREGNRPGACVFVAGDPWEGPPLGFVESLQRAAVPQNPNWFGYRNYVPEAQAAVAAGLRARTGLAYADEDVLLTNGAFAGLAALCLAVLDPGDEVIFNSPPWFFYESMLAGSGAVPVRVRVRADDYDLDLAALEAALTPRTRAVLVNSPNNPTGRIYPPATLQALADLLTRASARLGRVLYLISDEAYKHILFDGRKHYSPALYYPHTLVVYTYGKTLLTPGQRLGYLALPPDMPAADRAELRQTIFGAQFLIGFAFPNALLQYVLPELEQQHVDLTRLERRRDRFIRALRGMGYSVHQPEGAFYLLPRSPIPNDWAFTEQLAARQVFVLPGQAVEMPGFFRISLTGSDDMVDRALPAFAETLAGLNAG